MEDRISLLDQIKNRDVDLDGAIQLVVDILDDLDYIFNDFYLKSKYCVIDISLKKAISRIIKKRGNELNDFLNFYELLNELINIYNLNWYHDRHHEVNQIEKILDLNLEKLGWYNDFDYEKQCPVLRRKDLKAEMVACNQEKDTHDKIYYYLSLREGAVDEKRSALKDLLDDVEVFCKKKSSIKEIDKTKQFYQCVRHTKDDPKKEFPFYYADEEKWLDFIFQMIIDVLSFEDLGKRVKIVLDEENKQ